MLNQVNPALILVQAKSDPSFIDACRGLNYGMQLFLDQSEFSLLTSPSSTSTTILPDGSVENPVDIRPSAEFSFEFARSYLHDSWPQIDQSLVKANALSVSAISAILSWLEKNWTRPNNPIIEVQWSSITGYMQINADALR